MALANRRVSECVQGRRSWHPCRWVGLMAPTAHSYCVSRGFDSRRRLGALHALRAPAHPSAPASQLTV